MIAPRRDEEPKGAERVVTEEAIKTAGKPVMSKRGGRRRRKPSCETCFFGCRGLCALELSGPCATFRPDTPDGLQPPVQPALLVRDEGVALAT